MLNTVADVTGRKAEWCTVGGDNTKLFMRIELIERSNVYNQCADMIETQCREDMCNLAARMVNFVESNG